MTKRFYNTCLIFSLTLLSTVSSKAQTTPLSVKMSETSMSLWPAGKPTNWNYEQGFVMTGIQAVFEKTGDIKYATYIQNKIDYFVNSAGTISGYSMTEYNIDHVASGRSLLFLHKRTNSAKYKTAATTLRNQLSNHPRTVSKGFWHKKVYPNQMWLDGLYMAEPFYAEYSLNYNEPTYFDDICRQFILMETKSRDTATGLLYHAWDESKAMAWANPTTGCSPSFWGRSIGWYATGLVDALDYLPATHPKRDTLIFIIQNLAKAIKDYRDPATGVWYQVVDKAGQPKNYIESSATSMFVYALAKGARKGYIDPAYWQTAKVAYDSLVKRFVTTDTQNKVHLTGTCTATGLGGNPYRNGTYDYYTSVGVATDDARGVGAFLLASVEIELGTPLLVTDIQETDTFQSSDWNVFPQPTTGLLKINTGTEVNVNWKIYNEMGSVVLSGIGNEANLSHLFAGMYIIELYSDKKRSTKKIHKTID
jgi:unsaturated rhamnogalacturonyl hydrolase